VSNQFSINPDELQPNPWNTNVVSPQNEEKLAESVRQFGMFKPIVVREVTDDFDESRTFYQIIGGQHRWEASKRAGLPEIPVFNLGPISDDQAKRISLADNARYGADDTLELSKLLEEIGSAEDITAFLPYSETDVNSIFNATNIALDELELDESFERANDEPSHAEQVAKAPKTHTIMRFKVPLLDAEKITKRITQLQKAQGFTSGDELTNAGDALVHMLLGQHEPQ
jgi:ParB/RepB/Spo0J family partition protein